MAAARGEIVAGTYHITTRSGGPIPIFENDVDRTWFCVHLMRAIKDTGWVCRAFCLMTTHYHLLLEVADDGLKEGMRRLNGCYAKGFNARHGRVGHLFGERYYAGLVESDGHMLHLLRYIARNPVEAGLVARPSDWYWGSYRGCAGFDRGFPFVDSSLLRGYFSAAEQRASSLVRAFVGEDA
jgi:REP element-mobilizing transposase RayT